MKKKLKILFIASEMAPFAKTGGLADVVGTLPKYLIKLGHEVRIIIPKYSGIDFREYTLEIAVEPMGVWMKYNEEWCSVFKTNITNNIPVYFIEHHGFFNREGIYHDHNMNDYLDNPQRFGFFSRAALQLAKDIQYTPDIVHVHDWQTALVPAYLKTWEFNDPYLGKSASLLTVHNAAYQGIYSANHYNYLGIDIKHFHSDAFESHRRMNLLKGGIYFSDLVNTVSQSYADEIRSPYGGFGLAPYFSNKGEHFYGILNGVDYEEWSPDQDKYLPTNYSIKTIKDKLKVKSELQKRFLLKEDVKIPVIGVIGRFVDQKGFHLLAQIIRRIVDQMIVQIVILGTGDNSLEGFFGYLPNEYPGRVGSYIGFSNELAHLIEGGADFFLMPSIYEPCGLNQLYSLRYGTLPIVRATGGLNDTVINYNENTGEGTGFKFWDISADALYYCVGWAISTYFDRKQHIEKMIKTAMSMDYSWEKSALEYEKAYLQAIENKKNYDLWYQ